MNTTLAAHISSSTNMLSIFFTPGNLLHQCTIHNEVSLLTIKIFVPTAAHDMASISWGIVFSCSCIFWYSRQVEQCISCFLYWHSCLPSLQTHMQATSSSQFLYSCCTTSLIFVSGIGNVLIFFCLLWPHCLSLPIHVWWASISVCLMHHNLFYVANNLWYILWDLVGVHLGLLLLVCLVWVCTLVGLLLCW